MQILMKKKSLFDCMLYSDAYAELSRMEYLYELEIFHDKINEIVHIFGAIRDDY